MPVYDFQCNTCQKNFTLTLSIKEYEKNPRPKCLHCGSDDVKRIYTSVSVITSKKS